MSTLTIELPADLALTLALAATPDPTPAPPPAPARAAWLPAAVEALQAFRQVD